jgi:hypothetical protein
MIRLSQTEVLADPTSISALAEEFAMTGCARLPGFLTPPILKPLLDWVDTAQFHITNETAPGGRVFGTTMLAPETDRAVFLLRFILNRPALFRVVEQIADCPRLANFLGRLHRTGAGASQHIEWHHDAIHMRTLGICINLSTSQYSGGIFQIRDPSLKLCAEVGRVAPGDAFLFRVSPSWEHRLTPVESGLRTVGVGWFRTAPDWREFALDTARSRQILVAGSGAES